MTADFPPCQRQLRRDDIAMTHVLRLFGYCGSGWLWPADDDPRPRFGLGQLGERRAFDLAADGLLARLRPELGAGHIILDERCRLAG